MPDVVCVVCSAKVGESSQETPASIHLCDSAECVAAFRAKASAEPALEPAAVAEAPEPAAEAPFKERRKKNSPELAPAKERRRKPR